MVAPSPETHDRNDDADLHVMVATDGSDVSLAAIREAQRVLPLATHWELVSVIPNRIDPLEVVTGFAGPVIDEDEAREIDTENLVEADALVARTARALGSVPVEAHVLRGDPGPVLCDHAALVDADILVVGAHDRGLISRVLQQSVTDHVVRHAPCPVLVIPELAGR
ncbi:MAG: universal stress protein [Acidimicrobiales bacterium]